MEFVYTFEAPFSFTVFNYSLFYDNCSAIITNGFQFDGYGACGSFISLYYKGPHEFTQTEIDIVNAALALNVPPPPPPRSTEHQVSHLVPDSGLEINLGSGSERFNNLFIKSVTTVSDSRVKTNVANLELGKDFVMSLRPVQYNYRYGDSGAGSRRWIGFLSQEVATSLAATGVEGGAAAYAMWCSDDVADAARAGLPSECTTLESLRQEQLIAVLVKTVQEQQAEINAQRNDITSLIARVSALENVPV